MKFLKASFSICAQNFRKWQTDYRIWVIAVLLIVMVQIYVDDMRRIANGIDTSVPIWIFPFLYTQFHTKLIYTLPLVLLFCNAPFADKNQIFVYMRTGRKKWVSGQILYILLSSAAYYLFLLLVTLLSTIPFGELSLEWGKTLHSISSLGIAPKFGAFFVKVSPLVLSFFTPLQAVGFTFLVSWLSAVIIGLIIFFFNTVSRNKILGILVSSLLIVLSAFAENGGYPELIAFSPISWNTLDKIDVGGLTPYPSFTYCIAVFVGLIVALLIGIFAFGSKNCLENTED
ncbi:MAG: hypothetical protein ACI4JZ_05885 [Oscillospiraceae bacterium]